MAKGTDLKRCAPHISFGALTVQLTINWSHLLTVLKDEVFPPSEE